MTKDIVMDVTKIIVGIVCILLLMVGIGFAICRAPVALGLRAEYTTQISVETPDKIETAISDVMADLEKRDFVPVNMEVMWHSTSKTYVVHARGIDRTKLSKYEP